MSAAATKFSNVTDAMLADAWGPLKARYERAKEAVDEIKEEFDKRGLTIAQGEKFIVLKTVSSFDQLDTRAVEEEMGDIWVKKRSRPSKRTNYAVTPVAEKPAEKSA